MCGFLCSFEIISNLKIFQLGTILNIQFIFISNKTGIQPSYNATKNIIPDSNFTNICIVFCY